MRHKDNNQLTLAELYNSVSYDPDTGIFTRKIALQCGLIGKRAGWIEENGYRKLRVNSKVFREHRLAWFYVHGNWPNGHIDHVNGDRADNRIANLRVTDDAENNRNRAINKNNKSGVLGVKWHMRDQCWHVAIGSSPRTHLGVFHDFFEACCARKSAEKDYGYHFNHGRNAA